MEPSHAAPKKKKLSRFTKFILIVLAIILLSFVLQKSGVKVMNVTEEDSMIERPHRQ